MDASENARNRSEQPMLFRAPGLPAVHGRRQSNLLERVREKHLRCAPANSPSKPVIGELENRQTARFLRPLALGAWTYVAGTPTAKA